MQYQTLGISELRISRLCLGTMMFGTQVDQTTSTAILDRAFEGGFNCIDTAEMYPVPPNGDLQGIPEQWVGTWMAGRKRDEVILATKVTGPSLMSYIEGRRVPPRPEAPTSLDVASIHAAVEGSLQRLKTDYIDLYQVHWPARYVGGLFGDMRYDPKQERSPSATFAEIAGVMDDLIRAGKIRSWGVSNENAFGLCQYDEACRVGGLVRPVSIQNDFSLMNRTFEPELAEACAPRNFNMHLLVYGGLAGGTLSGKYHRDPKAQGRHNAFPQFQPRYHGPLARAATAKYLALAQELDMSGTELALAWLLSLPYVGSVITGATNPDQLAEQISATQIELGEEAIKALDAIQAEHQNPCNWTREYRP